MANVLGWAPLVAYLAGKESTCNVEDLVWSNPGLIPGLRRSSGEGKGYPLQCSGLENSMDYTVHEIPESQKQPSDFHLFVNVSL